MDRPLQQNSGARFDFSPGSAVEDLPPAEDSCVRNNGATRILVADNHPIFRDGLRMVLEAQAEFRVVGEAEDGEEAVRLARELKPDVLLLELAMPRRPGLDVLHALSQFSMPVRAIILASSVKPAEVVKAMQLGARGIVSKDSPTAMLLECIRIVMTGHHWVANENLPHLVHALRGAMRQPSTDDQGRSFGLTARELEVIAAVVAGYTNKDIAQKFSISKHTVKNHLTNIFDKLGVSNRLELVLFATENGLIDDLENLSPKADAREPACV